MKTWHAHIAAVRHDALEGREDPTIKELLNHFLDAQKLSDVEKRELLGDLESRKMLFWNGYERESVLLEHVSISLRHSMPDCFSRSAKLICLTELIILGAVHRLINVSEHFIKHHEKLQRHLSILTDLATSTSPGLYFGGTNLARNMTHDPTAGKPPWSASTWSDVEKGGGRMAKLDTVHEVAWMSNPLITNFPVGTSLESKEEGLLRERRLYPTMSG